MLVNNKLIVLLLLVCAVCSSQAQTLEYKYQSVFLYQFARQIEWPADQRTGEISIGVVGNAKVVNELETFFAGKSINARKVTVKHFSSPAEISYCHILFVPTSNKNNLSQVLQHVGEKATLVVTEKEGSGKMGSVINFTITEEGKFRFELNKAAALKHHLKVPNEIASLAIII